MPNSQWQNGALLMVARRGSREHTFRAMLLLPTAEILRCDSHSDNVCLSDDASVGLQLDVKQAFRL
jgi:hypothetical protein